MKLKVKLWKKFKKKDKLLYYFFFFINEELDYNNKIKKNSLYYKSMNFFSLLVKYLFRI